MASTETDPRGEKDRRESALHEWLWKSPSAGAQSAGGRGRGVALPPDSL